MSDKKTINKMEDGTEKTYTPLEVALEIKKALYKTLLSHKGKKGLKDVVVDILDPNSRAQVDPDELPTKKDKVLYKSCKKCEMKKKQGVPKGADPATHERCVHHLKDQGKSKSSAFAICNEAKAGQKTEKSEKKSKTIRSTMRSDMGRGSDIDRALRNSNRVGAAALAGTLIAGGAASYKPLPPKPKTAVHSHAPKEKQQKPTAIKEDSKTGTFKSEKKDKLLKSKEKGIKKLADFLDKKQQKRVK